MKKLYAIVAVLALSLSIGVTAMAQMKTSGKGANKAGCSSCNKAAATPEQIRKFKADTLDLRQEMMNKRFELQRENLKDAPDAAKVAALKADMETIKGKIEAIRTAAKLPESLSCGKMGCMLIEGDCGDCMQGDKHCSKTAKKAKTGKHCKDCDKKGDCGCANCGKGECSKCDKAANCSCSKKSK